MLFDKFEHEERFIAAFERFVVAQELIAAKMAWPQIVSNTPSNTFPAWPNTSPVFNVPNTAGASSVVLVKPAENNLAFDDLTEGRPMRVNCG